MNEITALLDTIGEVQDYIRHQLDNGTGERAAFLVNDINQAIELIMKQPQICTEESLPQISLFKEETFFKPDILEEQMSSVTEWRKSLEIFLRQNQDNSSKQNISIQVRNTLDRKFLDFIDSIKNQPRDKILYRIKKNYQKVDSNFKKILEDYFKMFTFWGTLDEAKKDFNLYEQKATSFHDHWNDYLWLYSRLMDYRSKEVLYAMLMNWYQFDFVLLGKSRESAFPDYFDLDILECDEKEVLVDLGAFTGDTVLDYIHTYGKNNHKRIYCYEITPATFQVLKQNLSTFPNIEFRQKGASDSYGTMYISANETDTSANILTDKGNIEVVTVPIDGDILEPVTFIKMDIEGAEQKALIGCKKQIQRYHPKLAISVYHNNEDIWKIPRMIDDICPGYQFYLRYHGGDLYPTEVTLLAKFQNS